MFGGGWFAVLFLFYSFAGDGNYTRWRREGAVRDTEYRGINRKIKNKNKTKHCKERIGPNNTSIDQAQMKNMAINKTFPKTTCD